MDSSKTKNSLKWYPSLNLNQTINWTFEWYKKYYNKEDLLEFTNQQITNFFDKENG